MVKIDVVKQLNLVENISNKLKDDEIVDDEDALSEALNAFVEALKPLKEGQKSLEEKFEELCNIVEELQESCNGFASKTGTNEKQRLKLRKTLDAVLKIKDLFICSFTYTVDEDYVPQTLIGTDKKAVEEQKEVPAVVE